MRGSLLRVNAEGDFMKFINIISIILVIIGGINWGLIGIFEFNLVEYLFEHIYLDRILYTIVGIASVYLALGWKFIMRSLHSH